MRTLVFLMVLFPVVAFAQERIETYVTNPLTGETTLQNQVDNRTLADAKEKRLELAILAADNRLNRGSGISSPVQSAQSQVAQYNSLIGVSRPLSEIDKLNPARSQAAQNFISATSDRLSTIETAINAATTNTEVDAVSIDFSDINY